MLLAKANNKLKHFKELVVAGAKLLFWNPSKSFFDMLPTTGPGYFSAG